MKCVLVGFRSFLPSSVLSCTHHLHRFTTPEGTGHHIITPSGPSGKGDWDHASGGHASGGKEYDPTECDVAVGVVFADGGRSIWVGAYYRQQEPCE